jgi:serine O-acetyltransferase
MIRSKREYKEYVQADREALSRVNRRFPLTLLDYPLRFQLVLRRAEYYTNCYTRAWQKPLVLFAQWRHRMIGYKCGYSIPLNVFGKGLSIAHTGTIVVNAGAVVGTYCRIHTCVNIGTRAGEGNAAPHIGDRVYIGPGAKLFGDITLADDIAVGANAVVNKSFRTPSITIAGMPARQISEKGAKGLLIAEE